MSVSVSAHEKWIVSSLQIVSLLEATLRDSSAPAVEHLAMDQKWAPQDHNDQMVHTDDAQKFAVP